MATISNWTPYGVAFNVTATAGTVKRTGASTFTVVINASWEGVWSNSNYGMKVESGGVTKILNPSGTYSWGDSGSFTGTYSISGNGASTQSIKVTFTNYAEDWQGNVTTSSSTSMTLSVSVPSWATKSSVSAANGTIGSTTKITITKNTSGVSDSLYYRTYNGSSWSGVTAIASGITASSYTWTIPTSLASLVPTNSKTMTCDIYWDSYYSGSYLGGGYSSNFTVTMPASLGAPTGLTLGSLEVQGKTATFNIGTPSFKYGASLSSYTINPSKGTASRDGNKVTITFNENIASDVTVSVYATDTRGFTSNTATITISPVDISNKTLSLSQTIYTYNGEEKKPTPTIDGLTLNTGYTVSYFDNINAGTATVTATGIGMNNGSVSTTFTIQKRSITERTMRVSPLYYTYDGTAKTPSVSIEGLVLNTDYILLYHNNIDAGVAIVEAVGRGNYKDVISKNFYILNKSLFNIVITMMNQVIPISKGGTGATTSSEAVTNLKSDLVDIIYPIGAIYMSVNSTNPSTLFGGTWIQLKDQFLLGAGSSYAAGNTGGAAMVTLTTSDIPGHTHSFTGTSSQSTGTGSYYSGYSGGHTVNGGAGSATGSIAGPDSMASTYSSWRTLSGHALSAGNHTHTVTASGSITNRGEGGAHNNMPPYLVVYMWKRTA